ncbi:hypothetical protein [Phytohabitans houttuyneae]|uniref:Uncharacterized protein n=1 Tax=Phytohabitans houttuyneae TaxID=1076126 RepID=A0A6V8K2Q6_9ACTN|nr:hypothetical protein [Phytohabitans houttuyneae]GFJ79413.1 hypothetical protein Phou_035930 [Phytohabitans houttuyneae]
MTDERKSPDRHETRSGVLARPDPELRKEAQRTLAEHGWTMNQFLIACLALVVGNPAAMLKSLERFKPPVKKPGPKPGRKAARKGRPTP